MNYSILKDSGNNSLWIRISKEMAHLADEAYSDSGESLYDQVVLTDKDKELVNDAIDDAIHAFVSRTNDIASYYTPDVIQFDVPDFDSTFEQAARDEINRYVVCYTVSALCQQRRPSAVQPYAEMAKAAADKAVILLKSRKTPDETW